jgi:hypothetical protein
MRPDAPLRRLLSALPLGAGELGVHGRAGLPSSVGLSGRAYLGRWINLTLQVEHHWQMYAGFSCRAAPICPPDTGEGPLRR